MATLLLESLELHLLTALGRCLSFSVVVREHSDIKVHVLL